MRRIIGTGTVPKKRQVIGLVIHGATVWRKDITPHGVPGETSGLRGEPLREHVEVAWRTLVF